MEKKTQSLGNPLGYEPIGKILVKFAIPSITAMVVNALYNIVDQIYIGWDIGYLGNGATNVIFPLVTISIALALLIGQGGASKESIHLGAGEEKKAADTVGMMILLMGAAGILLFALSRIFFEPMLLAFGSTEAVLPYAREYANVIIYGLPFSIFCVGFAGVIRADGSPVYAMISTVTGALLNVGLDPLFMFVFDMGIFGAALATVVSQFVSFTISALYIPRLKQVKLTRESFSIRIPLAGKICALGIAPFINQIAITIVQITLNNSLTFYGAMSVYGEDIPLACAGLISKVNAIFMAIVIGLAQANQPICGFNYGAKQYARVRQSYRYTVTVATAISCVAFLAFELFPRQIIGLFGGGEELYFVFAERYMRIFLFCTFINGIQPVTSNFFTAVGKAYKGALVAMTRQILFLLPLILIFPMIWGIDGIMFAGPVADGAAAILATILVWRQMRQFSQEEVRLRELPDGV